MLPEGDHRVHLRDPPPLHHRPPALHPRQRRRFHRVVLDSFVPDLRTGLFRPGLRIKGVRATSGVYELTWAQNGRATWQYGQEKAFGIFSELRVDERRHAPAYGRQ
ncbi:hypothetical protein San01_09380 [Streptomyces angustmyceticus]|uniref:Uncharacterized protein n=1 Tax=Streptomyces angustmyceticus TaxID=285578 RepID=A0A5J4L9D8_9ACTN|nr:hypothetical protein San01_09380 [Streptomyces angustmyceticus]